MWWIYLHETLGVYTGKYTQNRKLAFLVFPVPPISRHKKYAFTLKSESPCKVRNPLAMLINCILYNCCKNWLLMIASNSNNLCGFSTKREKSSEIKGKLEKISPYFWRNLWQRLWLAYASTRMAVNLIIYWLTYIFKVNETAWRSPSSDKRNCLQSKSYDDGNFL